MTLNETSKTIITPTLLTYGGDALGRLPDGRAVFVPFVLPGERVEIEVVEQKQRYARARPVEILEPSPERVAPTCIHYGTCGGCHYQHLAYENQVKIKTEILSEQLARIGGIPEPRVQAAVPSKNQVNYRNHVQFHLTTGGQLGYYAGRTKDVFPLQECHLPEVVINEVWPRLELDFIPGLEEVALRAGSDEDLQVILTNSTIEVPRFEIEDLPVSAVHISPGGMLVLAGSDRVYFEILEREFQVTAGAFFQVNTDSAARMVTHILETLPRFYPLSDSTTLMDVYCGVGLFSAFLAPHVGRLIGIESSPAACADFEVNLEEFDNVELYEATAEEALPLLAVHPEVVLVDPPRSGIDRYAMDALIEMAPAVIVYVSCDPSTLGRDGGKLLRGGYRLEQVTPFDLFPHTYHIESISFWVKA